MKNDLILQLKNFIAFTLFIIVKNLSHVFFRHTESRQILFINFGQIGDLTISSLLFDYFTNQLNIKEIDFLINDKFVDFFLPLTKNTNLISLDINKYQNSITYRLKTLKNISNTKYSEVYNLNSFNRIMLDEIALSLNYDKIYCFESYWKALNPLFRTRVLNYYNEIISFNTNNEYFRHILLYEKIFDIKIDYCFKPTINLSQNIVIAPFSSSETKEWQLEKFMTLAHILSKNFQVIIVGNHQTKILKNTNSRIVNLLGKTSLPEVQSIIKGALLFIGNDSGLTHIAHKFQIPLVGIIGGGTFGNYFPILENKFVQFVFHKMDCFNCEWYCKYKEPLCLNNITVEEVFSKCEEILTLISKQKEII